MTRRMVYDIDVAVAPDVMYTDFTGIDYWHDLVDYYRANDANAEIAHFATGAGGTDVAFQHILSAADLPAVARPILPGRFVVTRIQHFEPFRPDTNSAAGDYRADVPKVPVSIDGDYVLHETETGSRMRLESRCAVRVPLIGGQIEGMLIQGLTVLFAKEAEFTSEWITAHH